MKILVLGCMLFGEAQGADHNISVVDVLEVKVFETNEEASEYGEEVLDNGGDSYFIYDEKEDIYWNDGTLQKFNSLKEEALNKFNSK